MLTLLLNAVHNFHVFLDMSVGLRLMKIAVNYEMRLESVAGCTPSILRAMINILMCTVT